VSHLAPTSSTRSCANLDAKDLPFRNVLPDSPSYRRRSAPQFTRSVLELLTHSVKLLYFWAVLPQYGSCSLKLLRTLNDPLGTVKCSATAKLTTFLKSHFFFGGGGCLKMKKQTRLLASSHPSPWPSGFV